MTFSGKTLADRMGTTIHQSPLRFKVRRLMRQHHVTDSTTIEDWLVVIANQRGAGVVFSPNAIQDGTIPSSDVFSNEELVIALCQLNCADRPQILRPAAQLISRNQLDMGVLLRLAVMERATRVLKELAAQALSIVPGHPAWHLISQAFQNEPRLPEPLLHWSRLAEPLFAPRSDKLIGWKLVA